MTFRRSEHVAYEVLSSSEHGAVAYKHGATINPLHSVARANEPFLELG